MDEYLLEIFQTAKELGAADIHIRCGLPPIFRVNKELKFSKFRVIDKNHTVNFAKAMLDNKQYHVLKKNRQIDFSVSVSGVSRFRANAFLERGQLAFVFRQIPFSVPSLKDLHIRTNELENYIHQSGLFLVTGPTGAGKSTTITAIMNHLNQTKNLRIITLEDPIEYLLYDDSCDFNQREYRSDFFSFHEGLRAALRQDPDVIVVGEMREKETIRMGLMAAETGHMVISTLHTTSVAETVERIVSVFPGDEQQPIREQFCSVCRAIMSQQLVKRVDKDGLYPIREIMLFETAVRNIILGGNISQITHYLEGNNGKGMISLNQSIIEAYKKKYIGYDQAMALSNEPDILKDRL